MDTSNGDKTSSSPVGRFRELMRPESLLLGPRALASVSRVPAGAVNWGLSDVGFWLIVSQVGSAFWVSLVAFFYNSGATPEVSISPEVAIGSALPVAGLVLGQAVLWFAYGVGPLLSSRRKGNGAVADFGARLKSIDIPVGIAIGVFTQLVVLWVLYKGIGYFVSEDPSDAARSLIERANGPLDVALLVFLVVIAAPAVEELFYRGLFLRSVQAHLGAWPAILVSSVVFAAVHFQPLQAPGLFVFGVISGWLAVRTSRLGPSWAMHVAFNAVALAGLWLS